MVTHLRKRAAIAIDNVNQLLTEVCFEGKAVYDNKRFNVG